MRKINKLPKLNWKRFIIGIPLGILGLGIAAICFSIGMEVQRDIDGGEYNLTNVTSTFLGTMIGMAINVIIVLLIN
jgi:uncharacterized membrane protein YidH (DUF202 family)